MRPLLGDEEYLDKHFSGLDLSDVELAAKEFENCDFRDCNFSNATLLKCRFIECRFVQCNLSLIKVSGSKFRDVGFDACKALGINWTRADWPRLAMTAPLNFTKCILNDSSFQGLVLEELVLDECKARDVDFRDGNFSKARFMHTDFSGSLFNKTNLSSVDFTEASNYDINVFNNNIHNAKFTRYEALRLLDSLGIELIG
jgi:fluoroquinolone resistance protein